MEKIPPIKITHISCISFTSPSNRQINVKKTPPNEKKSHQRTILIPVFGSKMASNYGSTKHFIVFEEQKKKKKNFRTRVSFFASRVFKKSPNTVLFFWETWTSRWWRKKATYRIETYILSRFLKRYTWTTLVANSVRKSLWKKYNYTRIFNFIESLVQRYTSTLLVPTKRERAKRKWTLQFMYLTF